MKKRPKEIKDYDETDTTQWIDPKKSIKFEDLGYQIPKAKPTQVVSLRLPTKLLNGLRSLSSRQDVAYQNLIKIYLWDRVERELKKIHVR